MTNFAKVSIEFGADFEEALAAAFALEVKRRQDRIRRRLRTKTRNIFKFYLKTAPVAKSLNGKATDKSLQAELGLADGEAQTALNELIKTVDSLVKISVKSAGGSRTSGISDIVVDVPSPEQLENALDLSSEPFAYTSSGKHLIQWMKLVLNPSAAIIDEFIPDIFTPVEDKNGNEKFYGIIRGNVSGKSRSGFAIMAPKFNSLYRMPSILIPAGKGKNFVDTIFRSRNFRNEIIEAIQAIVAEELNR